MLAEGRPGFFTIPHFDNYAAVLISLPAATAADLRTAITDAWLAAAPTTLARTYTDGP